MKGRNMNRVFYILVFLFGYFGNATAQVTKEQKKQERDTQEFLSEANAELTEDNFVDAEVGYRKAISVSPSEEIGKYNLGNAYYNKAKNDEAMRRFAQAAEVSEDKTEKHKAYHNLGNTFMNAEKYQEAVESYKNALRNNPNDDESRYNLALAKEMLEKNPPQGDDGENDNKDEKDNEDKKDENKDNKEKDDGKEKEGDDGEEKEDKDKGEDEKEKNEGDKEGDNEKPEQQDPKEKKDSKGDDPKE
ncbi:MAG: tetratricopeptide repeat protein, partial [Bacteroidetes bacterium]|nr:tetratricopeptide repeat protein [Bacteroidota bacterium]